MIKKLTSGKLQDIEIWIKIVKAGNRSNIRRTLNRLAFPAAFWWTDKEWLGALEFEERQEIERITFFDKLKAKRRKK